MKNDTLKYCACGCGNYVKPGNMFVNHHNRKGQPTGREGIKFSEGHKKKLSEVKLGKKHPEWRRKQASERALTQWQDKSFREKQIQIHKKYKLTEEHKKKIGLSNKGEKSGNWLGGKSFELYGSDWTEDLKESIRKRDKYICQMEGCGKRQNELNSFHKKHDVHHIDYDKQNLNPENLITLCKICHRKTNFNRGKWIKYFNG
jgi:hypothetical protein